MLPFDHAKLQSVSLAFIALIGAGVLLHITQSFMVPFVLAVLLSFLLIPVADFMVKCHLPGFIANTLVVLAVLVVLLGVVIFTYGAFSSVTASLPKYTQKYSTYLQQILDYVQTHLQIDLTQQYKNIRIEHIINLVSPSSVVKTVNRSIGEFLSIISRLTLMMLFLMFIISSRSIFIAKVFDFFHTKQGDVSDTVVVIKSIGSQIQTYLFLKTLISLATGFVFGLVAYLCGLDFAFIWGFWGFLLNFIPTIGPIIASIPPIFMALLQFDNLWWALFTSLAMSAVQFTSGSFVEPLIMGDRLNLNIIAILLSLLLWGMIWGIPGMFLAVPITGGINIICRNLPSLKDASILLSK